MTLSATRRALHGVAELLLAGPQYRRSGTIRLTVVPGGFGTVAQPSVRVEGGDLVTPAGRYPLTGTYSAVAAAAGLDVGAPKGLYHDSSAVSTEEEIVLDPFYTADLHACFALADDALRALDADATPVIWPEHFDIAITVDEVNYGVSPGDGFLDEPYAYVGPHKPREGTFWNAPFGAARPIRDLDGVAAVTTFFRKGRERAGMDPAKGAGLMDNGAPVEAADPVDPVQVIDPAEVAGPVEDPGTAGNSEPVDVAGPTDGGEVAEPIDGGDAPGDVDAVQDKDVAQDAEPAGKTGPAGSGGTVGEGDPVKD